MALNKKLAKSVLVGVLKIGFSVVVLSILVWKARQEELFQTFMEQEKNWGLLVLAGGAYLSTVVLQLFRWRLLARSLELEMSPGEALRLGFLSQLFSLIGVGMLGGDALKTYILGKHNRGRITEALTSVMVDRIIGLYGLIMMAGGVSFFFDFSSLQAAELWERETVYTLCWLARAGAVGCTIALCVALLPGFTHWAAWDALGKIPKLGGFLRKLVAAMRMYRRRIYTLLLAILMSFAIHTCSAVMFCCLSQAIPAFHNGVAVEKPPILANFMAALLALGSGAVPIGGLELVFDIMYRAVSSSQMPKQQGFLLVLAFRLIQMCTATIGLFYYLRGRREVDQMMHEAQEVAPARKIA